MENAKDDNLVFLGVDLMHDDVGETGDRPFECSWGHSDMAYLGKFVEAIAIHKNAVDDMRGRGSARLLNVEMIRGNVLKCFERAAQLPNRDFFLPRSISGSVARRVVPSWRAR